MELAALAWDGTKATEETRRYCGCRMLEEIRLGPITSARASMVKAARAAQARWGCPMQSDRGDKPPAPPPERLPVDLAEVAQEWAETVGLVPLRLPDDPPPETPLPLPRTCPLVGAYTPTPWQRELLRAHRLMIASKGGLRFEQILGREPTARDIEGLDALVRAQGQATESDAAIRRAEAEAQRLAAEHR